MRSLAYLVSWEFCLLVAIFKARFVCIWRDYVKGILFVFISFLFLYIFDGIYSMDCVISLGNLPLNLSEIIEQVTYINEIISLISYCIGYRFSY